MLVVDLHTLQAVHCLNLVHDILLSLDRSEYIEDVAGRNSTVGKGSAGLYIVVLLNKNLLGQRHQIVLLDTVLVADYDFAVTSLDLAHQNLTVDLGENSGA